MGNIFIKKDQMIDVQQAYPSGENTTAVVFFQNNASREATLTLQHLKLPFNQYAFGVQAAQKSGDVPDFSQEGIEELQKLLKLDGSDKKAGAQVVAGDPSFGRAVNFNPRTFCFKLAAVFMLASQVSCERGDSALHPIPSDLTLPDEWTTLWNKRQDSLMKDESASAGYKQWLHSFDYLRNKSILEKAQAADSAVDAMLDYKSDQKQYNQKEYCASPIQIFNRKKGDCEDFAILKDGVLDYLAVPLDRRYLLAVDITDTIKFEGPSGHGILAIDMSPKNDLSDIYILDEYSFGDITPLKNTSYTPFSIMNRKKSLRVK